MESLEEETDEMIIFGVWLCIDQIYGLEERLTKITSKVSRCDTKNRIDQQVTK